MKKKSFYIKKLGKLFLNMNAAEIWYAIILITVTDNYDLVFIT